MNIYQAPNGKWRVRVRRRGCPPQTKYFNTESEARTWGEEIEAKFEIGNRSDTRIGEKTTLRELLQRYLDEIVPSAGNPKREGNRIKALMRRDIASFFVAAIRPVDIGNFIAEREAEGVGGNTIRLDVAALSKLFNLARTSWGFDSIGNPTEKVRRPKVARGRERRLNGDEEQRLLDAASEKLRPVIQFALETAMRREEIASLKWSDVDFERHVARLQHTKNGEPPHSPTLPCRLQAAIGHP